MKSVTQNGQTVNLPRPKCTKCPKTLTYGEWDYNDRLRSYGHKKPYECRSCARREMKERGWDGVSESIVV